MTSHSALIGPRLSGPSRWSWLVNTESRHPDPNGVTAREATEVVSLRTILAINGELLVGDAILLHTFPTPQVPKFEEDKSLT